MTARSSEVATKTPKIASATKKATRKSAATVSDETVETPSVKATKTARKPATAAKTKSATASSPKSTEKPKAEKVTARKSAASRWASAAVEAAEKPAPKTTRGAGRRNATKPAADETPVSTAADIEITNVDEVSLPLHVAGGLDVSATVEPDVTPAAAAEPPVAEPPTEDKPTFTGLGLSEPILRAVAEMGYVHPTPIQAQAIPAVLNGRDVLGVAQTGTGKTASFTLPMLETLSGSRARARMPRSLILEPTRELALQVAENFVNYGKYLKLTHALLIGGESMADQKEALNRGVDVLIATPGRLIDLFERGGLLMNQTRTLVIDEADRMLDMGFIPDIERIVGLLPRMRQTLFFSATMAPEIRRLADAFLQNPVEITVSRPSSVATTIETGLVVVDEDDKRKVLRKLLRSADLQNAIVFCNRKRDVDMLLKSLQKHGFSVGALHGDLPQSVRFSTLEKFKAGELKILVCSDVAARGIDIGGLSHVFNFDLPFHAEDYVHRIGRTGRAGREGRAYSIATPYDRTFAEAIEKLTGKSIPRLELGGVAQLEWSEEARPRHDRGKKRRDDRGKKHGGESDNRARQAEPHRNDAKRQDGGQGETAKPHHTRGESSRHEPSRNEQGRADAGARDGFRRDDDRRDRNRDRGREARDGERNQRHKDHRRRDEIPADTTADGVPGFGADAPAFMSAPRRLRRPAPVDLSQDGAES
ncbi:DEAD/DEAH box helicase [Acetobacter nitrogenifigens]|uniref:DEAD/DEAH box helicase n=1 Tax=Acetobacter nitrogenifigens TaxID=285268 RepID=UPI00353079EA